MHNKYAKLTLIAGGVLLLDQLAKAAVVRSLPLHASVPVIEGFFNLTHVLNPGGAFGLMAGLSPGLRSLVFLLVSALSVGLILYFYHTTPPGRPWLAAGFALILGGAIGNLIDRLRVGAVVDFLDFYVGSWHWPAFNVADSAITAGVGIFVLHLLTGHRTR